jgi:hypothetical protein
MPLPAIPPLFVWALGALGAAAVVKAVAKEWRRVNAELDEVKNAPAAEPAIEALPKLKRDPDTGVYRPH